MANINTLIIDCQEVLRTKGWFTDALAKDYTKLLTEKLQEQYSEREQSPTLRLSKIGRYQCPCALWHSVHSPDLAEPFEAWTENKFTLGHMVEAWAITLMKAAGHKVEGEQDELELDGIKGHRDCVVDGCLVDVKSAAARSYQKFKDGTFGANSDSFGYLAQLDGYVVAGGDDPLLTVRDRAYLLAIHKELGHLCLYEHRIRETSIRDRIVACKQIVGRNHAPPCECPTKTSKTGNVELTFPANYNDYKFACQPGLRKFISARGPVYFTKVVSTPLDMTEVDKYGNTIYRF